MLLNSQIKIFDKEIGKAMVGLCPKPKDIDDKLAQALFEGLNVSTLRRGMSGTTFTGALIDGETKEYVGRGSWSLEIHRQVDKLPRQPSSANSCQYY